MGLDAVEILMAVEETFGIEIKDEEAQQLQTPRQLIDLVKTKVARTNAQVCLTHRSFCLVRRFLMRTGGLSRKSIRPDAALSYLLTKEHRHTAVSALSIDLGTNGVPALRRPTLVTTTIFAIAVGAAILPGVATRSYSALHLAISLLAVIAVSYIGVRLTRNLKTEFPKSLETVGDLSRFVMTHKPDLATPTRPGWTDEQIASGVRDIVVETLGCEKTYREDAQFIKDLGLS